MMMVVEVGIRMGYQVKKVVVSVFSEAECDAEDVEL